MTIQDHSNWNTLERVTSSKLNEQQNLRAREQAEVFLSMVRLWTAEALGTPPTLSIRTHIASGLQLEQSGGVSIKVLAGMLGQQVAAAPPAVPAQGTYDSSYRFGLLMADDGIGDPWDATNAWWLAQARVEQVITTSNPDIYDPATDTFAPSGIALDTRYESQVVTYWKKGTATTIATPDAGYAPLGAVYRPAGGGAIAASDIVQLSTQLSDLSPISSTGGACRRTGYRMYNDGTALSPGSAMVDVRFQWSGEIRGVKLYALSTGDIILRSATFVDPVYSGSIATADLWWYVYLAAVDDEVPSGVYTNIEHRGSIIVSRVPPDNEGRNSAQLSVPDPVGGSVAAGEAIHVGVFQANGVVTDIYGIDVSDNGEGKISINTVVGPLMSLTVANSYQNGVALNFGTSGAGGTEEIPYGVTHLLRASVKPYDAALSVATGMDFSMLSTAGANTVMMNTERFTTRSMVDTKFFVDFQNNFAVTITSRGLNAAGAGIAVANINNNEYEVEMIGFRF